MNSLIDSTEWLKVTLCLPSRVVRLAIVVAAAVVAVALASVPEFLDPFRAGPLNIFCLTSNCVPFHVHSSLCASGVGPTDHTESNLTTISLKPVYLV